MPVLTRSRSAATIASTNGDAQGTDNTKEVSGAPPSGGVSSLTSGSTAGLPDRAFSQRVTLPGTYASAGGISDNDPDESPPVEAPPASHPTAAEVCSTIPLRRRTLHDQGTVSRTTTPKRWSKNQYSLMVKPSTCVNGVTSKCSRRSVTHRFS